LVPATRAGSPSAGLRPQASTNPGKRPEIAFSTEQRMGVPALGTAFRGSRRRRDHHARGW
jgi:hypothetical protein